MTSGDEDRRRAVAVATLGITESWRSTPRKCSYTGRFPETVCLGSDLQVKKGEVLGTPGMTLRGRLRALLKV